MTRRQRALHVRLWIVLVPLIAGIFTAALTTRARVESATDSAGQGRD